MKTIVTRTVHMTVVDLIAAGHYDHVERPWDKDLSGYYSLPDSVQIGTDPQLFHIERDPGADGRTRVWQEEVLKGMDALGCRPATIWELLDYGAEKPEVQVQFPVVALGTVTSYFCNAEAPVLNSRDNDGKKERTLGIYPFGHGLGGFHPECRFLMYPKGQ